jgi:hypothetical protein
MRQSDFPNFCSIAAIPLPANHGLLGCTYGGPQWVESGGSGQATRLRLLWVGRRHSN